MFYNLLPCLFGICFSFVPAIVALEALVGGHAAEVNQFPYQVALQSNNDHLICGGGIISELFILTAAHCMTNDHNKLYSNITVLAGTNNLHHTDRPTVRSRISKMYFPREFNRSLAVSTGDIVVLKLTHPLDLTHPNLRKIKLPENQRETYVGKIATITGFGWNWVKILDQDSRIGNNTDGQLRFAEAHVLDNECLPDMVHTKHLCARIEPHLHSHPRGTCAADSGSLLVDENQVAIGVLSMGLFNCDERDSATIYTRISHYLTFIRNAKEGKANRNLHEVEYEY